ncbi:MAG: diguanylate cyclase [Deltaproteobacteria bacterium]|nr:diguanylate cyclase [Deltaproteobacteria bacterium]
MTNQPPPSCGIQTLRREHIVRHEALLRDGFAAFVPHTSTSLHFPRAVSEGFLDRDGSPRAPILEGEVLHIPLAVGRRLMAVMALDGVQPDRARPILPVLPALADLLLERVALIRQAQTDPLTGLTNAHYFQELVAGEIRHILDCILPGSAAGTDCSMSGFSASFALLAVNLNRFRPLNTTYGHAFGDRILAGVAESLLTCIPVQATPARLEKDTFTVLWPQASPGKALVLAEEIRENIGRLRIEYPLSGEPVTVSASIGVTCYPQDLTGRQLRHPVREQTRSILYKACRTVAAARAQSGSGVLAFPRILTEGGLILETLPLGRLVVNLGRSVDVREGQRFLVWSSAGGTDTELIRDGQNRVVGRYPSMPKAEISIIEVQDEISIAELLTLTDPSWPVGPGDHLTLQDEHETGFPAVCEDTARILLPGRDTLTGLFTYRGFLEKWTRSRERTETCTLMLVRLDNPALDPRLQQPSALEGLVESLHRLAVEIYGKGLLGGRYCQDGMILFVPAELRKVSNLARDFVFAASERHQAGLTIGCAGFPFLSFARSDLVENVRKALEHAFLLEAPRIAAFDSTTLTISADRYFARGDLFLAMEEYKLALAANEDNILAANSLGICLARLGRLSEARSRFAGILGRDAENLMALYNLGCTCLRLGDLEEAQLSFRRCLNLDPRHIYAILRLGQMAEQGGDTVLAESHYRRAGELDERVAHRHLGRLALKEGKTEKARSHLHAAVVANPMDAASLHLLARIYLDRGDDPEMAESFARQSVYLNPGKVAYWDELARSLDTQGRTGEAAQARSRADSLG